MTKWDGWFWRYGMWCRWTGWWRARVKVRDALGRDCRVYVDSLGDFAKTLPSQRGRPLFWATLSPRFHITVFAVGVCAMVVLAGGLLIAGLAGDWKPGNLAFFAMLLGMPSPFVVLGCLHLVAPWFRSRYARKHVLRACAVAKVCPNCHYLLDGLEPSAGAVKCPECGFAWRVDQGVTSTSGSAS